MSAENTEETNLIDDNGSVVRVREGVKRYVTVEPAVVFALIYFGGIVSVTQQYVYQRLGLENNVTLENENSSKLCKEGELENMSNYEVIDRVQKEASYTLASFNAVSLAPMLVSAVMLGSYSDKIGRKFSLVLPSVGGCIRTLVIALVVLLKLNLYYIYIGVILDGLFGGAVLFLGSAFSYISDITTSKQRTFRVIVLELCITLGLVLSQLGVGYLIRYLGFLAPILVLLGCNIANILYVIFFLQESLHRPERGQAKFWTLENHKRVIMLYVKDTVLPRRWKLQVALLLLFLVVFADLGRSDVKTLYILGSPFCFTSVMIGYYSTWSSMLPGLGGTIFTKLLETRLTEMTFFIISGTSNLVNCVLTALVPNTVWLFVVSGVNVLGRLQVGMLRSFSSKLVQQDEQGALFSSIAWVEQAAVVVGAVCLDTVYAETVSVYSGIVFFVLAGMYLISTCIASAVAVFIRRGKRKESNMDSLSSPEEPKA